MKRIFMGIVWFMILFIVVGFLAAMVTAIFTSQEELTRAQAYLAGEKSGERQAPYIALGAFLIAIIGTLTGKLPGTKKKSKA